MQEKNVMGFEQSIRNINDFKAVIEHFPDYRDALFAKLLEPQEYTRLVENEFKLTQLITWFPAYTEQLIAPVVKYPNEFKRLLPNFFYFMMLINSCKSYTEMLIAPILNNIELFEKVISSGADLLSFKQLLPTEILSTCKTLPQAKEAIEHHIQIEHNRQKIKAIAELKNIANVLGQAHRNRNHFFSHPNPGILRETILKILSKITGNHLESIQDTPISQLPTELLFEIAKKCVTPNLLSPSEMNEIIENNLNVDVATQSHHAAL